MLFMVIATIAERPHRATEEASSFAVSECSPKM